MSALLCIGVALLAACVAFVAGVRYQRSRWRGTLTTDPGAPEAGREWAADMLGTILRDTRASDPIAMARASDKAPLFKLHFKTDLGVYVYVPEKGAIVHGKDFRKWCSRVYREYTKNFGGNP